MIKSIHIQNFRCFEDLKLEGLGRVNLIGGMNNSGKTVLLEGVWLGAHLSPKIISEIKRTRFQKNASSFFQPEVVWNDLFFNSNLFKEISIKTISDNTEERLLELSLASNNQYYTQGHYGHELRYSVSNEKDELLYETILFSDKKNTDQWEIMLRESAEYPFLFEKLPFKGLVFKNVRYYPTKFPIDVDFNLADHYSQIKLASHENHVLEAFKIIDASIIEVEVLSLGQSLLYARRNGEPPMPIEMFGDATKKIAEIVLQIVMSRNGIFLIDEIENGIHFTNQLKVWDLIFRLAKNFNVQVFATTHSKEMAEAFNKTALERDIQNEAKYIEMARHGKTKKLIGMTMEMNILKHKLVHNKAFRGE